MLHDKVVSTCFYPVGVLMEPRTMGRPESKRKTNDASPGDLAVATRLGTMEVEWLLIGHDEPTTPSGDTWRMFSRGS